MFGVPFLKSGRLWFLLTVESAPCGLVGLMAFLSRFPFKVSLSGEPVSVFRCVELDFISLECNKGSVGEF